MVLLILSNISLIITIWSEAIGFFTNLLPIGLIFLRVFPLALPESYIGIRTYIPIDQHGNRRTLPLGIQYITNLSRNDVKVIVNTLINQ